MDMHGIQALKPLALLSFLILTSGLAFLVYTWPLGRHATFSQHAAAQKHTVLYYIALFAASLPMLFIFFVGWFVPRFNLPSIFSICAALSITLQHAVTLIPEVGGWKTTWHRILTGFSATLLLPMVWILTSSPHIPQSARILSAIALIIMVGIMLYHVLLADKETPKNQLLLQSGYYGAFFLVVLFTTYVA